MVMRMQSSFLVDSHIPLTTIGIEFISFYGIDNQIFIFGIVLLNMASRLMEMIVLYTIFMKFSSKDQAGTDFTVLVCAELLIYILGMSLSGFLAANIGYSMLFALGGIISIPGYLIALLLLQKLFPGESTKPILLNR
ncbi:hypothetical protein ACP8HZ_00390 [Francisella noatunensis]